MLPSRDCKHYKETLPIALPVGRIIHQVDPSATKGLHLSPLLCLPTEVRLRVYEYAYDATFIGNRLHWHDRLTLTICGTLLDLPLTRYFRLVGSPFTLLRVCRQLNQEVAPLLPDIRDVRLHFEGLEMHQLDAWFTCITPRQLAKIRHVRVTAWDKCHLRRKFYIEGHRWDCQWNMAGGACNKNCREHTGDAYVPPSCLL